MRLFQILLALMLVATVDAKASSFDCTTAISLIDLTICASPQVLKLDDELSDVYVKTLLGRSDADDLKTAQKAWKQGTRNRCEDEACLVKSYLERITALKVASIQVAGMGGDDPASDELIVKIGHIGPTSGALAHLGRDNELAARMAIEDLNAKHLKIGEKVATFQLQAEDDASDPIRALAAARKLVANNVSGVVGHLNSGASIPASKLYSDAGIPQISPSATNPRYTRQGFKTAFRVIADDSQLASTFGRYAVEILKGKNFAVIADTTTYGHVVADEFEKGVKAAGGTVVGRESTSDKSTEFSAILTKLKSAAPDVLFFGGLDTVAGPMLKQLRQLGMTVKFMGPDGICTAELSELAGDAIGENTVYCAEAGGVGAKFTQPLNDFKNRFRAKNGIEVQMYSPYVYDAVNVLADAMVRARTSEPSKYLPQVAQTNFVGLTGPIAFDEKGDIKDAALTIYTFRHGKREQIEVYQPEAAASGQAPSVELAAAPEITPSVIAPPVSAPPMPALAAPSTSTPSVTQSGSTRENSQTMGPMNRFHGYILLIVGGVVIFIAGIGAVVHRMFRLSRHQTGAVELGVKEVDSQTNRLFDSSSEFANAQSRPTPSMSVKPTARASPDYGKKWESDDYRQTPIYLKELLFGRWAVALIVCVVGVYLGYARLGGRLSVGAILQASDPQMVHQTFPALAGLRFGQTSAGLGPEYELLVSDAKVDDFLAELDGTWKTRCFYNGSGGASGRPDVVIKAISLCFDARNDKLVNVIVGFSSPKHLSSGEGDLRKMIADVFGSPLAVKTTDYSTRSTMVEWRPHDSGPESRVMLLSVPSTILYAEDVSQHYKSNSLPDPNR